MDYPFSGLIVRYKHKENHPSTAPVQEKNQPRDELHVNLWEIGKESFLDIGIKIHAADNVEHVRVDLPWCIKEEDIIDLGTRLNSEKSIAAIFNEVVKYEGAADQNYAIVTLVNRPLDNGDENKFILARLHRYLFKTSYHQFNGCVPSTELQITIPSNEIKSNDPAAQPLPTYIRFRIRLTPKKTYCTQFKQKDRALLSSSVETRIVDFRINVRRGIPEEILITSPSNIKYPDFKKIHCFITLDRGETCEFQNQDFVGCRSLMDEDIWDAYIKSKSTDGQIRKVKDYLGYQWTASSGKDSCEPVKDLLVLGRFSKTITDKYKIIRFMILIILMGMTGSALWDFTKTSFGTTKVAENPLPYFHILTIIALIVIFAAIIFELEKKIFIKTYETIKTCWKKMVQILKNEFKRAD